MVKRIIIHILVILMLVLWIGTIAVHAEEKEEIIVKAKIIQNNGIEELEKEQQTQKIQKLMIRIEEGEYQGEEHEMQYLIAEDIHGNVSYPELEEKRDILVKIEKEAGEITQIVFEKEIHYPWTMVIMSVISLMMIFVIGRKKVIAGMMLYFILTALEITLFILAIQYKWNTLWVVSIFSVVFTLASMYHTSGLHKETFMRTVCVILAIAFVTSLFYGFYEILGFVNIEIKIAQNATNIKELLCSMVVIVGSGIANSIAAIVWLLEVNEKKWYKKKSNNIIEGQRSLKL